jgi:hypothetical protein
MTELSVLNAGKLEKAMNRLYDFGDKGIMSLKEFFKYNPPLFKKIYVEEYSQHRVHLEYRKHTTPKVKYEVFYNENRCIEVPKMYYDILDVPVKE